MRERKVVVTPDAQRSFEAARREILAILHPHAVPAVERGLIRCRVAPSPQEVEKVRWLVVSMGLARGGPGGLAVAALAERGWAVPTVRYVTATQICPARFDAPRLLSNLGVLPRRGGWRGIERTARAYDPEALEEIRYVSAHETLRIKSELAARGHRLDP